MKSSSRDPTPVSSRVKRTVARAFGLLVCVVMLLVVGWAYNLSRVHKHCIKSTGFGFRAYSDAHGGELPSSTKGFGDAMLLLVKEGHVIGVEYICGPGDDGKYLAEALEKGLDVAEDQCTRVYVQGLKSTDDRELCLMFDRRSVRGGDHSYGYGPRLREVCMLDGSMGKVRDPEWPAFCRKQVELLTAAGWTRKAALTYWPDAEGSR